MTATPDNTTRRAARRGFTLIEMLVIIVILILLIGIIAPAVLGVRQQAKRAASLATITLLEGAIRAYQQDFESQYAYDWQALPDSEALDELDGSPLTTDIEGRHRLVWCLTGLQYADGAVIDDGADGYGFRTIRRGPVHGPYNGAEGVETTDPPTAADEAPLAFVDAFGNEIYYYRYDPTVGDPDVDGYDEGDNAGGPANIDGWLSNGSGTWATYRRDFVLMTQGPDGEWAAINEPAVDDVTNFLEEEQ